MAQSNSRHSRYRRSRRRNSHYGVLVALILLIIIAIPVGIQIVKKMSSGLGGSGKEVVFQAYNPKTVLDGNLVDVGASALAQDPNGVSMVSIDALEKGLGLAVSWEQVSSTLSIEHKKDTIRMQVGSTTLRINDETKTMQAAPTLIDNIPYFPIADICETLSWKYEVVAPEDGDLVIVVKSKKDVESDKMSKIKEKALAELGPSRQQTVNGSIIMRVDSDKMSMQGETKTMKASESNNNAGFGVLEIEGKRYIPMEAAIITLEGTAEKDEKGNWTVNYQEIQTTISNKGKARVGKDTLKGEEISTYTDEKNGRFYVSAQLFAKMIGKMYTALDGDDGAFALTNMDLTGYDSQRTYLSGMINELSNAKDGVNVPAADNYIAFTFDDGPTGSLDGYDGGLTAYLLDELKARNAHATFFMCGYRLQEFNSHCERYLAEGHELGNHTMNHPMQNLTVMSDADVKAEIENADALIEQYCGQKSTVMRPVGGAYNDSVCAVMKELGLPVINWDVDTHDWKNRDAEAVKSIILSQVADGSVVLMHDLYPTTVEGALLAIDELNNRDETYAFVTISELAAIKGVTLEPGKVYTNITEGMDMSADNTDANDDAA